MGQVEALCAFGLQGAFKFGYNRPFMALFHNLRYIIKIWRIYDGYKSGGGLYV